MSDFLAAMDAANGKVKETIGATKANNARLAPGLFDEMDVADTAVNAKLDAYGPKTCGSSG